MGVVFKLSPPATSGGAWTYQVLYAFGANANDVYSPYFNGLAFDFSGNLWGTSPGGGAYGSGGLFELTNNQGVWSEQTIYSFGATGTDGQLPWGNPVFDSQGNLYGTSSGGGVYYEGTVWEWSAEGSYSQLYSFGSITNDAEQPYGALAIDSYGNLYGETRGGGANGHGAVFELSPASPGTSPWTENVLWSLGSGTDGRYPYYPNILLYNGNLYGTTSEGGAYGQGTVFEVAAGLLSRTTLSGPSTSTYGESVTLTATVASNNGTAPTGSVTFMSGSTRLGSATLTKSNTTAGTSIAGLFTSALPAGSDSVTATYSGSGYLTSSTSAALAITVSQATSSVSLSSSSSTIAYGQAATITATVDPAHAGPAGGTVTFTRNGSNFLTVNVASNNTASFSASELGIGTFTIGASFSGDSNVAGSTAAPISQTVTKDTSSTTTTSSATGTSVSITATVTSSPEAPSGAVAFYNAGTSTTCGGTHLGNANLSGGSATLKVTLAPGTYNLCSVYEGSSVIAGSTSPTETQVVE